MSTVQEALASGIKGQTMTGRGRNEKPRLGHLVPTPTSRLLGYSLSVLFSKLCLEMLQEAR